ncbi:hypothetical protein CAPTEDRAFT_136184, partial [Capitella teleta]
KGTSIKGAYYAKLLEKVRAAIKEKRRGLLASGQCLQQNNSPSHNRPIDVTSGRNCGFKILPHSLSRPDPSDYKPFGNLKRYYKKTSFYKQQ